MLKRLDYTQLLDRCTAPALREKDADPSRLYRARSAILVSLVIAFLNLLRLGFYPNASVPVFLCLLSVAVCIATLFAIRRMKELKGIAWLFLLSLLSIEASFAIYSQSIFNYFYSWLPLSIAFCCFFSGLRWGGSFTAIAIVEALIVVNATKGFGPQVSIYSRPDSFLLTWQLHFILVELFGAGALFTFAALRLKGQKELQERHILSAKTSRKAALADVVGSLAHELNNPLAIIHGSMLRYQYELSKSTFEPGLRQHLWECMSDALVRIEGVANALKTFAGGDANEPVREITLQKLLQAAEKHIKEKARSKGVTVTMENPHAKIILMCRPQQTIFVLSSLLDNACEALQDHSAHPEIRVQCTVNDVSIRIAIIDNGPGMEPMVAERMFQPFITTASGESLGMALSISRGIVEEHGGRIGFARELSETHFWFELPLGEENLS